MAMALNSQKKYLKRDTRKTWTDKHLKHINNILGHILQALLVFSIK
jgi:hypothetical protein